MDDLTLLYPPRPAPRFSPWPWIWCLGLLALGGVAASLAQSSASGAFGGSVTAVIDDGAVTPMAVRDASVPTADVPVAPLVADPMNDAKDGGPGIR